MNKAIYNPHDKDITVQITIPAKKGNSADALVEALVENSNLVLTEYTELYPDKIDNLDESRQV